MDFSAAAIDRAGLPDGGYVGVVAARGSEIHDPGVRPRQLPSPPEWPGWRSAFSSLYVSLSAHRACDSLERIVGALIIGTDDNAQSFTGRAELM